MMTPDERQYLLERLVEALRRGVVTVELLNRFPDYPYRLVANTNDPNPTFTVRARDYQADNSGWLYWWLWKRPIESVNDLARVVDRFCDIVLTVEGKT
jgi:hypothetical protein